MIVEFEGQQFEMPDDITDDEIAGVLNTWQDEQRVEDTPDMAENNSDAVSPGPSPMKLDEQTKTFVSAIRQIESGGLSNPFIRTKIYGSSSTAYGPYQITGGLLQSFVNNHSDVLDERELQAAQDLLKRQKIAITIGGKDRKKYEKAGTPEQGRAAAWAGEYGYPDIASFLDAFDYGGDYGLGNDAAFHSLYENIARKLLVKTIDDADGDLVEAAARWHGGSGWRLAKSRKQTEEYIDKFRRITEMGA